MGNTRKEEEAAKARAASTGSTNNADSIKAHYLTQQIR